MGSDRFLQREERLEIELESALVSLTRMTGAAKEALQALSAASEVFDRLLTGSADSGLAGARRLVRQSFADLRQAIKEAETRKDG